MESGVPIPTAGFVDDPEEGIKTHFSPIEAEILDAAPWSSFWEAGTDWLQAHQLLVDERERKHGVYLFHAQGPILAFSFELHVKALTMFQDHTFDPLARSFRHSTANIIKHYRSAISVFEEIASDSKLMLIIREYEKWVQVRYGGTYMGMPRDEYNQLFDALWLVRNEMGRRLDLRRATHLASLQGKGQAPNEQSA